MVGLSATFMPTIHLACHLAWMDAGVAPGVTGALLESATPVGAVGGIRNDTPINVIVNRESGIR